METLLIILTVILTVIGIFTGIIPAICWIVKAIRDKKTKAKKESNSSNLIELSLGRYNVYYDKDGNPYCPACYASTKHVPLQKIETVYYSHECPLCKAAYMVGEPKTPPKKGKGWDPFESF